MGDDIGRVLELRDQVVATMCMPGQRMFGESLLLGRWSGVDTGSPISARAT